MNLKINDYLINIYYKMFKVYGKNSVSLLGENMTENINMKMNIISNFQYKNLKSDDISSMKVKKMTKSKYNK